MTAIFFWLQLFPFSLISNLQLASSDYLFFMFGVIISVIIILVAILYLRRKGIKLLTPVKIAVIVLAVVLVASGGIVTMVAYQVGTGSIDNPRFCSTCHIMTPFVEDWEISVHGQTFVKCHECHETGFGAILMVGRYLVGAYEEPVIVDLPSTQVSEICSQCHVRGGLHDVETHQNADCRQCHGMHGPGIEVPKLPSCLSCHEDLPDWMSNTNCYNCHPRDDWGSPLGHVLESDGELDFDTCSRCHITSGDLHVEHSETKCSTCHVEGGFEDIITSESTCIDCHPSLPNMFPNQSCDTCHTRDEWGGRKTIP
jgi:hypothetical protein